MFTRSQGRNQEELHKEIMEQEFIELRKIQMIKLEQQEELLKAVLRVKNYLNDIDNVGFNNLIWNYQMHRIELIKELYTYLMSSEAKQTIFVLSFPRKSKFLEMLLNKTQYLRSDLLDIIKKEMIEEYRDKQNELLSGLNELEHYLKEEIN